MHRIIILAFFMFFLTSCASVQEHRRISSSLQAAEFNSISSEYRPRPTFLEYVSYSSGVRNIIVKIDLYGTSDAVAYYSSTYAEAYIDAINKFLEWAELAAERKDMFTKEIATVKSGIPMLDVSYKFSFHSGNEMSHFMVVDHCALMCVSELGQVYDVKNAKILKDLLVSLKENQLSGGSIDDIYK